MIIKILEEDHAYSQYHERGNNHIRHTRRLVAVLESSGVVARRSRQTRRMVYHLCHTEQCGHLGKCVSVRDPEDQAG